LGDEAGVSIEAAKLPDIACGDGSVEFGVGEVCPAIEGDQFYGELGKAACDIGLFCFDDENLMVGFEVVVEVAV